MNTYHKFVPNVFLAKCTEKHEKGETIVVTTKYGKENESIVFNLVAEKNGYFYKKGRKTHPSFLRGWDVSD